MPDSIKVGGRVIPVPQPGDLWAVPGRWVHGGNTFIARVLETTPTGNVYCLCWPRPGSQPFYAEYGLLDFVGAFSPVFRHGLVVVYRRGQVVQVEATHGC